MSIAPLKLVRRSHTPVFEEADIVRVEELREWLHIDDGELVLPQPTMFGDRLRLAIQAERSYT